MSKNILKSHKSQTKAPNVISFGNVMTLNAVLVLLIPLFSSAPFPYSPLPSTPKIGLICSKMTSCRQVVGANRAQMGTKPA